MLFPICAFGQEEPADVEVFVSSPVVPEGSTAYILVRASTFRGGGSVTVNLSRSGPARMRAMLSGESAALIPGSATETLISVSVMPDDDAPQTEAESFDVMLAGTLDGGGSASVSPQVLSFTIPPNDLEKSVHVLRSLKGDEGRISGRSTRAEALAEFSIEDLQGDKTLAVSSSPGSSVFFRSGIFPAVNSGPFPVFLESGDGRTMLRELLADAEAFSLRVSYLDVVRARESAQISGRSSHTCGIRIDNTVACWGQNSNMQSNPTSSIPKQGGPISRDDRFLVVSARAFHTCAIRVGNTVACWGSTGTTRSSRSFPPMFSPGAAKDQRFFSVSAGGSFSCGITIQNEAQCWGISEGSHNDVLVPTSGAGSTNGPNIDGGTFFAISAGNFHTCAIRTDGTAACWGANDTLADPGIYTGQATVPDHLKDAIFSAVSAGAFHNCGILIDNTVECWGDDSNSRRDLTKAFHLGTSSDVSDRKFLTVSAGLRHTCGILMDDDDPMVDGTVACWGDNASQQSSPTSSTPEQGGPVSKDDRFLAVSAGSSHTCGIRVDNTAACWGSDADGRSIIQSSAEGGFREAAVIPDAVYLFEKQEDIEENADVSFRSEIRLRIKVFLEGALR